MSLDWLIDRGKWRSFALALRQEFDNNKGIEDEKRREQVLLAGQHLVYKYRHPEPYICKLKENILVLIYISFHVTDPSAPGGSAYDRETRLPQRVKSKCKFV